MLRAAGVVFFLIASVATSVFGTQAHQYSSPAALALVAAIGSFCGVLVVFGLPGQRSEGLHQWLPQVLLGAGGFALAPWIVMANRYTDAPPGSEVVFFSTACWGVMLAIGMALMSRGRVRRIGGALLALAGAAAVVANWERPSSFSPFVRYAREESLMLLAGLLWVALVLLLAAAAKRKALPAAALRAALGGIAGAIILGVIAALGGTLTEADFGGAGVWAFAVAVGFATAAMLVVLRSGSAIAVAGVYVLVPASMTVLLMLEQVFGVRGPNPLLTGPSLAATASSVVGIWLAREHASSDAKSPSARPGPAAWIARVLSGIALAAALAALALPGMTAAISAIRADGSQFKASFGLYGFEVAGTWLALGVAVAALGIAIQRPNLHAAWPHAAALIAAAAAWPFVAATPLRTLTSFIPSDVQVDYGSEFARIDFTGGPPVLALVALGGALLAVAVTLLYRPSLRQSSRDPRHEDDREVVSL